MRLPALNTLVKRLIAGMLVRAGKAGSGTFTRQITLGPDLRIADEWQPSTLARVVTPAPFSTIHMASAGYWQAGDLAAEAPERPGGAT
jgi:hypothetical protein